MGSQQQDVQMSESDAFMYQGFEDDPELAMALKMSMMEEEASKVKVPDEPKDTDDATQVVTIQFRFSDGSKLMRKFFNYNTILDVQSYLKREKSNFTATVRLTTAFPKKVLEEPGKTLKDYGVTKNETLNVEMK